jgi:hypothetical protein
MMEKKTTRRDIEKGVSGFKAGEQYRIVICKSSRKIIELEDVHFNHNSAVLLPGKLAEGVSSGATSRGLSGMAALGACLKHAKAYPEDRLLIAGHTDTTGDPSYNDGLSLLRARHVDAALMGNRDTWISIAEEKNKVEDRQYIVKWFSENRTGQKGERAGLSWNCDPGAIDNNDGENTKTALKNFQKCYNADFSGTIKEDGKIGPETWGAFFDVYMDELKKTLATDDAGLLELRNAVSYADESRPCAGCGESHPIEEKYRDRYLSKTNRRVEMLFFNQEDVPVITCQSKGGCAAPKQCPIYGTTGWDLIYIDTEGNPSFSDLVIEWPQELSGKMPADLHLNAAAGDTSFDRAWSAGIAADGVWRLVFEHLRRNVPCTLTAAGNAKTLVLWREQNVFNPDAPPTWEHVIEEFATQKPEEPVNDPGCDFEEVEETHGVPSYN